MKTDKDPREEKELLESIIRKSAVAMFVLDACHKVVYWNEACEELTGTKAQDVVNTDSHWKAFYDHRRPCVADIVLYGFAEDLNKFYKTQSRSILSKGGLHAEDWFLNLGGKDRYLIFDAAPIYNKEGDIIAAVETLEDITALKRSEEAFQSQKYLSDAFKSLPTPAAIVSIEDKRYLEANRSWERRTGYRRDELVGSTILRPSLWADPLEPERLIGKAVRDGGFSDAATMILSKAGEPMTWLISAELLEYAGQKCVILSGQDMSGETK